MTDVYTILIVDDMAEMREVLEDLLAPQGYQLLHATSGPEALALVTQHPIDVMLLDVMMPGMDGFEVCRQLRAQLATAELPVLLITALDDRDARVQGFQAGADDFISKPFDRAELRARLKMMSQTGRYRRLREERARFEQLIRLSPDGILIVDALWRIRLANPSACRQLGMQLDAIEPVSGMLQLIGPGERTRWAAGLSAVLSDPAHIERMESLMLRQDGSTMAVEAHSGYIAWEGQPAAQVVFRDITARKRADAELQRATQALTVAYDTTLEGWSRALDLRDHETEGHSRRVTELSVTLARSLGMRAEQIVQIRRGALLHDIGKLGIPDHILRKPGALTDEEWETMKTHPTLALELLAPIEFLRLALDIPHYHHEKWDGGGYPHGLKGEEIPLAARIFAIVDVWDALSQDRYYRKAWNPDRVREHIRSQSGRHFDPAIVESFLALAYPD